MSGQYNEAQAIVRMKQPLAHYVHCIAHASNLIAASVARSCSVISTAQVCVNELGVLVSQSGKLKAELGEISINNGGPSPNQIKPLCPRRWHCRVGPVWCTLVNHSAFLGVLEEKNCNERATGLLDKFGQGNTCLGMIIAVEIFSHLENLNKAPKRRKQTISGALAAFEIKVVDIYHEINSDSLKLQVPLFRKLHKFSYLEPAATELLSLTPEVSTMPSKVRQLFSEVEQLVKLVMTSPASSCEAERCFSTLRRLKTYLGNTLTQKRLNFLIMCHIK
ncbi:hypothetical protein PR048_003506 [Dryococelus australis]|uniref:HAT C-terminal dimerisation domain-containing protein n=1 Tax=Dryococelus australis TaxID=614101 RepID=A0ABQ9IP76_9NEOP|nr:hypothetical protein PR048_003506 [Dryococelus australis]